MPTPFAALADTAPQTPLRAAITAATRRPEPDCVAALLDDAAPTPGEDSQATALATRLAATLRAQPRAGVVERLVGEFSLSSAEGVALMCLAEALLRIPDDATRDALIRDKVGHRDWAAHLGGGRGIFVNAAAWGLLVTGRLAAAEDEGGLAAALTRLVARAGEPVIRRGMDAAMRLMGEQFVMGETIEAALARAGGTPFRHSFDMLGEAAATAEDAAAYLRAYEGAIAAIGRASAGRGPVEGPGISVKLSALHPRYGRAQRVRVSAELWPRVLHLAEQARRHGIGLTLDAEESERLDLSLDILEALCGAPSLRGWDGIGFVVQAYGRRAPFVLDWIVDLARRTGHRVMLRLVKGAYWDSEIKRAQVDGMADFPVLTRKIHTDVSFLACARRLLGAPDAVFPQFATHNARSLAAIHAMAAPDARFEFQGLHGMGEALHEAAMRETGRPCRIYAPVGTHETLLAYLVRRLLENGANSSFVHRIHDASVPLEDLARDPVAEARALGGTPHPAIAAPRALFGTERRNSAGLDLACEATLARLAHALPRHAAAPLHAAPPCGTGTPRAIRNPADNRDVVGEVREADAAALDVALARARPWDAPPAERAAVLDRAAGLLESATETLLDPLVREAGKTLANAVGEVREAVDFLRYHAAQVRGWDAAAHVPLGLVACISPWNFPLAIFLGQASAALAAGNAALAKPAEETPLVAAMAVRLLHGAGVPESALQLLPGDGAVGAALVADARVRGVMFTGSTEVARLIARTLAARLNPDGSPVPLVAETGGQNAMLVDSSALPEQVVADVLASAFDSAGQRCSALRLLLVQEEAAERILHMLRGAMAELTLGNPDRLSTDIGPVISADAREGIAAHLARMGVRPAPLPEACAHGHFVAPALVEIAAVSDLTREVFGPVLHVLRVPREGFEEAIAAVNATGYALTFGVQSRLDGTARRALAASRAGNLYVNRSVVGAVVGVQPFGGHGLSGTGPKAGGPLLLRRLLARCPAEQPLPATPPVPEAAALRALHPLAARQVAAARPGLDMALPGPVGGAARCAAWRATRRGCACKSWPRCPPATSPAWTRRPPGCRPRWPRGCAWAGRPTRCCSTATARRSWPCCASWRPARGRSAPCCAPARMAFTRPTCCCASAR